MTTPVVKALVREILQDNAMLDELAKRVAVKVESSRVPQPYLNTAEAAEFLRCGTQRIHTMVHQGRLRPLKEGARLMFRRTDLEALLVEPSREGA